MQYKLSTYSCLKLRAYSCVIIIHNIHYALHTKTVLSKNNESGALTFYSNVISMNWYSSYLTVLFEIFHRLEINWYSAVK